MTSLDERPGRLWLHWLVFAIYTAVATSFVNYSPGYEYVYKIDSVVELSNVQSFVLRGEIGFVNIAENDDFQELFLSVHRLTFSPKGQPEGNSRHHDFSKWFTFEINKKGEIRSVYHPLDEDAEVLMTKKGFAGLLSAKLHHRHEVAHHLEKNGNWRYSTNEVGREGQHSASYSVKAIPTGIEYTKTRKLTKGHAVNGNGTYIKRLHFHEDLKTIHSIMVKEELKFDFSTKPGFNPLYGMRPVKAISNFSVIDFPEINAKSNDNMTFVKKTSFTHQSKRPKDLIASEIHIVHKIKKRGIYEARSKEAREYVAGNMTCINNQPERGSPEQSKCFHDLVSTFKEMQDADLEEISNTYFLSMLRKNKRDKYIMVDVFIALNEQNIVVNKILNNLQSEEQLITRVLTLLTSLDKEPQMNLLTTIEKLCLKGKRTENVRVSTETRLVSCLTFGGLIRSVKKYGKIGHAENLVQYLHNELGLHDPWLFKQKRSTMTEVESVQYDHNKVILLHAIGNAGLPVSYEYIVSHINSTNSPWIKRSGVHALGKFHDEKTLHELKKVATFDEDENVRFEALLQYKAHPLAVNESDVYQKTISDKNSDRISKRSILDQSLAFRLEAPGVDWRKHLGTSAIGASFGVIMENLLDLHMSLIKGHIDVRVHDEAYVKVHLGFIGINYDYFLARICFKGGARYALNILKELDPALGFDLISQFKNIVNKVVGAVRNGINALKHLFSEDTADSLTNVVDDLVQSVNEIPTKVASLSEIIKRVMEKLAIFKLDHLPPFTESVMKFVNSVITLYERVKEDVLKFYNSVVQGVKVLIPKSADEIFDAVQDITRGFMSIFRDPKTSIFKIGSGVIRIYTHIKILNGTIQEIKKHTFITEGAGPYWGDLTDDVEEIFDLYGDAVSAIKQKGSDWIKESAENDIAEKITKGKISIITIKQKILTELESEIQTLISPLEFLSNIGGGYLENFDIFVTSYKDLADAFETLKKGYEFARSMVDRIFGPKFHKDFPREKRVSGDGCSGNGFYPSKLSNGNNEYQNDGIDLLKYTGDSLVAPFSGVVIRSKNENEIVMLECGELPIGSELVITNVEPEEDIMYPDDPAYYEKKISAGVVLGKVTKSPCGRNNHIHVSIQRNGGLVDPSNYVPERPIELPKWKQECDDYTLVYQGFTIKSDVIVGPWGRNKEDTSQDVPVEESMETYPMSADDSFDQHVQDIKDNGLYSLLPTRRRKREIHLEPVANLDTFVNSIKVFLNRFDIRRVKMGEIINFLDGLGLEETRDKMEHLVKTTKAAIDQETCYSPYHMTNQELENALLNRGKQAETSSRDDMIKELLKIDHSCPFITFTIPTTEILYCTLDEKCLGLECCITIEAFDLLEKTFKMFVRVDPSPLALYIGFDSWSYILNSSYFNNEFEGVLATNIKFDYIDDLEIVIKYRTQPSKNDLKLSVGLGLCYSDSIDECYSFFYILKDAVFPIPTLNANGMISYQSPNIQDFAEDLTEYLIEPGESIFENAIDKTINSFLEYLGISRDILLDVPSFRPVNTLATHELVEYLNSKSLSTEGSLDDLKTRYLDSERSCSMNGINISLPDPPSELIHYKISENCMHIDAFIEISVSGIDFSRTFSAYVELDPCHYVVRAAFEKWDKTVILFEYDWGKEEVLKLTNDILITFRINKKDEKKVFLVDVGIKFSPAGIDEKLLREFEIPIPICNGNFSLQGSLSSIAEALGGEINREVFDLVLKQLGVDKVINEGQCILPPPPTDCPPTMDISQLIPKAMKDILQCELAENCFGISCCVNVSFTIPLSTIIMNISFPVWFQLDPCDFYVETGIGNMMSFKEQLLKYEWGKELTNTVGTGSNAPIKIIYAIDNYEDAFTVNFRVEICLPIEDQKFCIPTDGIILLENEHIPACSLTTWTNITDFSFEEWMQSKGERVGEQLSNAGRDALLELLGMNEFLRSPSCDRKRSPYSPSMSGWNNLCPKSFLNLPHRLPSYVSCSVPDYCTGINCCLDIENIGLSINAYIDINLCNYVISGGIETATFNFSLFNYEWGKTETVSIKDLILLRFSIKKPTNEKVFIITMQIAVCLERDGSCMIDEKVLDGTKVPQPGCDMSIDLSMFSVSTWFENNGLGNISINDPLWDDAINYLTEVIGLDEYFLDEQCDIQAEPYKNATNEWYNECEYLKAELPDLPEHSVCHIGSSCTSLDCCIYFDFLRRPLQASFNIDFCNYTIQGNLEKSEFRFDIIDFMWGREATETVLDLLQIRYKIVKTDKHFIFDLSIELCMDSRTSCQPTIDIYRKAMIPIPVCNFDAGIYVKDFSLNDWLNNVGSSTDDNLPTAVVALLLRELNIDTFQQMQSCSASDVIFSNASNGWTSDCSALLTLPILPEVMVCYMNEQCTGIDCCVSVDILRTTIHVKFLLDTCRYKLTMGIERLEKEVLLFNYHWGETDHFTLGGVFQIEFRIDDLQSHKKFIVNAKLKICFEQSSCLYEIDILTNAYIPKPFCDWKAQIIAPDFTLEDWMNTQGYLFDDGYLKEYMIEQLLDTLGLSKYLDENECDRAMYPFSNDINGWTTECPTTIDSIDLPDFITCNIPSYCTGIDCCVYVDIVKRSFKLYLHIDQCNNMFSIGIENFGLNISLLDYESGKMEQFSLMGALRIRYSIINLESESQFLLNFNISICIKETACEEDIFLLENARIPKIGCESNASLSDFNLDQYLNSIGAHIGNEQNSLSEIVADKLLETLGVAMYLLPERCERTISDGHLLVNECHKLDIDLKLPDIMTCTIPSYCTGITCCINIPVIGRSINVTVHLDACAYKLTISLEKLEKNIQLFDYEWGTWELFDIKGVFKIKYRIDDLKSSKQFVLSVHILACFDGESCSVDEPIVENILLPKHLCNFDGSFSIPDFSLKKWIEDNTNEQTDTLTDIARSILFEQLGLTPYLLEEECDSGVSAEWTKDCPLNASLPSLSSNIHCILGDRCSGFTCCIDIPLLQRSFSFNLDLDLCNFVLTAGIEKLEYNQSLINYDFGQETKFDLFGVIKLAYTIFDDKVSSVFKLSADVSICMDAKTPCDPIITLLDKVIFPKPLCNWDMPLKVPGFKIDNWLQKYGLTEQSLKDSYLEKLLETLGLSHYFKDDECSLSEVPYKQSVDGWSTECPLPMTLPSLPDELRCYVPNYCTAVECCLDVGKLKRGFNVFFSIDACSNRLVVGIENFKLNLSLTDYDWGSTKVMTLMGVVQITYRIEHFEESRQYGVDIGLNVCLSHDKCELQMELLKNTKIAKPFCRWDSNFLIPEFSLEIWLNENNVLDIANLLPDVTDKLLKETGLNQYLKSVQCDRTVYPFSHLADRWTSGTHILPVDGPNTHILPVDGHFDEKPYEEFTRASLKIRMNFSSYKNSNF